MRLIAEWEYQEYILAVFPFSNSSWDINLKDAKNSYINIIKNISKWQKCILIDNNNEVDISTFNNNVKIINHKTDDIWIRDFGPISVKLKDKNILKEFIFNGWGNKFNHYLDNRFNQKIFNTKKIDFILEGGAIETNGSHIILTSKNTILNPNRNPNTNIKEINRLFDYEFGIKKVIILQNCYLKGDDTDSHIDMFCRFVGANTIMYISTDDKQNPNYYFLKEMQKELRLITNLNNQKFNLIKLPLPKIIIYNNRYLPATYANFLITNKLVLVPVYGDKENDKLALKIVSNFFKTKQIVAINSIELIKHGGAIHCATMPLFHKILDLEKLFTTQK